MYNVNIERLKETLFTLSRIGYNEEDKGIYRPGFSAADFEARNWLMDLAQSEGFRTHMDGAGNVHIEYGPENASAVVVGSHLDSVPAGGMFDGTLGVIAGLECLRVLKHHDVALKHPVRVVATAEEEGRFGGMFGAQALTGKLTPHDILTMHDADGYLLSDAMKSCGLDPMQALSAAFSPEDLKCFIELHIEQGPVLDQTGIQIGVVDGISGVFKWIVKLVGKADHAGTAPMEMRSDAFMGLADFAHEINRIIDEDGTEYSRITVGKAELKPGFAHTIAGEVDFTLVVRDMDQHIMEALSQACRKALSAIARRHQLMFEYEQVSWLAPQHCSPVLTDFIAEQAQQLGLNYQRMPSGAGHDCQFFTSLTETGLIFIPSVNGISHAPDEWSHWHDVEAGANLLLACVATQATSSGLVKATRKGDKKVTKIANNSNKKVG
ncbi:Zn-dependent hydrolase [Pseudoalteromonas sp. MM17-2]|uniref:Zn-dependent hydrolase n=1 Tax=unclassified Pseudoalteromonas TaxID=194690 RepID=UPI001EF4E40A|nr:MULTISPECIES: Zn-dependent hydrolase [unclassified Pseudoalteromonas]MCG7543962.1 Zn-dependent hydrolase [Pseudoalteromonas sp. MM17-2]MCG7571581.1 Zn-dependent hydrolase [Pseudoalteromonas sp. CNC9-20]